jgi:type I restriction enzyme, S subunit
MNEWKKYKIDDLKSDSKSAISIGPFGSRMKSDCYISNGVPVIRGNNISDMPNFIDEFVFISEDKARELKSSRVYENDLVFPHRGNIGEAGIVVEGKYKEYIISSSLMKLSCNTNLVYPRFLYYFFKSHQGRKKLLENSSQVGTPGIATPLASLKNIDVSLPSLPEQKRIAGILSCLDRKIENLRKQNETLEEIARSIFKHWFIDFEFPNADGKPYKSSGGVMVRSELGDIPEGWHVGKLGDITRVINGRAYKQTEFREEGTPIVRIQNLTGKGKTVYSDLKLNEDKYISSGDLIYAWSATFGAYFWRGDKSIYHYHIWKLECFSSCFKYYLYLHLKIISDSMKGQGNCMSLNTCFIGKKQS